MVGDKQWYVVNTYSGHENKVADDLKKAIKFFGLDDKIFDILVVEVTEKIIGKKKNSERIKKKNLYPGYVFVEMIITDDVWNVIRNIYGVIGFDKKPSPVSPEEMESVLKRIGRVDNNMYFRYKIGDLVKIIDGPLVGSEGTIISINQDTGICQVEIKFFGRSTPTDINFSSIEKS